MQDFYHKNKGFTLLEVLLVVAAIAILAGIVIFAINPGKQLAEMRNGQRRAAVSLILNAVYQYAIDNGGNLPPDIEQKIGSTCLDGTDAEICQTGLSDTCSVDLTPLTLNQKYLVAIPVDPSGGKFGADGSGYSIIRNSNNRIEVCAPQAELGVTMLETR